MVDCAAIAIDLYGMVPLKYVEYSGKYRSTRETALVTVHGLIGRRALAPVLGNKTEVTGANAQTANHLQIPLEGIKAVNGYPLWFTK